MKNPSSFIKIGPYTTSQRELKDLTKSWAAISLAFAILLSNFNLFSGTLEVINLIISFFVAALTVGIGFIIHELSHKIVAQKYGCKAEFRAFDNFLIISIFLALFLKLLIAAPGAVMISGPVGKRRNGKISAAGPASNLLVALGFLIIALVFGSNIITYYGIFINSILAAFNLIPIAMFDGKKIFNWNKAVWSIMAILSAGLIFISNL
jgi:Zn-dependent protease